MMRLTKICSLILSSMARDITRWLDTVKKSKEDALEQINNTKQELIKHLTVYFG